MILSKTKKQLQHAKHLAVIDSSSSNVERLMVHGDEIGKSQKYLIRSKNRERVISNATAVAMGITFVLNARGHNRLANVTGIVAGLGAVGVIASGIETDNLEDIHGKLETSAQRFAASRFNQPLKPHPLLELPGIVAPQSNASMN